MHQIFTLHNEKTRNQYARSQVMILASKIFIVKIIYHIQCRIFLWHGSTVQYLFNHPDLSEKPMGFLETSK